ncbi:MAG: flavin prenyltransferase UbiX [Bdellovibrionota bacterium]
MSKPWIIALTGASGTCYGRRLIELLLESVPDIQLDVIFSEAALRVLHEEEGIRTSVGRIQLEELIGRPVSLLPEQRVTVHSNRNIGATIASGSYLTEGMIIAPCSMKTLAAVANGYCENLIQRAADVVLKEKRKLIIVPRETPLSAIHLENMLKLARMDVRIVPAMPGFYQKPKTIADLVDNFTLRLADQMGFELAVGKRWGEKDAERGIGGV